MSRTSIGQTRTPRALACALVFALFAMALLAIAPPARAALTVTVVLDKASYLSGDTATAEAIVYRTPGPGNYTYSWEVSQFFGPVLATEPDGDATYRFDIPLDVTGILVFEVTVDDGTDTEVATRSAAVAIAYMAIMLDRADFNPGETINAFYSLASHVITSPTYDYEVEDSAGTIVLSGNTTGTSFSYRTPNPASPSYTFRVVASQDTNSTEATVDISQASGVILGMTFDRPTYAPGETIRLHLSLTARGTTALPSQFRWFVSFGLGTALASATTTRPEVDLVISVPSGTGTGDVVLIAQEVNTGAFTIQSVRIGPSNPLWSTEIGGLPLFAVLLALLFVLVLLALAVMWRRMAAGRVVPSGPAGGPAPPPPPEAPRHAPTPMSVACKHCGKPIDITTSKRPIEVMCPSCGEPQVVM
jgi:hypothetical protein